MHSKQPDYSGTDPAAERFVERMGQLFESDGFTRIAGRIFGHLVLQREPQSLEELSTALRVSKGSVSQDTRALERLGALERVTRPGDRRMYYHVSDDMHERMLTLRVERFEYTRAALRDGLHADAARDARVRARLQNMHGFFGVLLDAIRTAQTRWQDGQTPPRDAASGDDDSDDRNPAGVPA